MPASRGCRFPRKVALKLDANSVPASLALAGAALRLGRRPQAAKFLRTPQR